MRSLARQMKMRRLVGTCVAVAISAASCSGGDDPGASTSPSEVPTEVSSPSAVSDELTTSVPDGSSTSTSTASSSTVSSSTVSSPPSTTADAVAVTGVPLETIEARRVDALREFPGFSATVTSTDTIDAVYPVERTVQFAALADGAFRGFEETTGEWEWYDPAEGIVRRATLQGQEADELRFFEEQRDRSDPPSSRLVGSWFAASIEWSPETGIDISESMWDDRLAWTITYENPRRRLTFDDSDQAVSQTEFQVVDQATGLIVVNVDSMIGSPDQTTRVEFTDLEVIDSAPQDRPGTFPAGADVEAGTSELGTPIEFADVPGYVGIPVPLPEDEGDFSATTAFYATGEPSGESIAPRVVDLVRNEGFLRTTVSISADAVAPESPSLSVRNGFTCPHGAAQQDECNPPTFASEVAGPFGRVDTIGAGLFAGFDVIVGPSSVRTGIGPFVVEVRSPDEETAMSVIESFVLVG